MQLPPDFDYKAEVDMFVSAMGYKLHQNRHKGRWENMSLGEAVSRLQDEVHELEEALNRDSPIEILMETADVANFALIIASIRFRELGVALAPVRPRTTDSDSHPYDHASEPRSMAYSPSDFTSHGVWMDGNRKVSQLWKGPGGYIYYEDVPEARERGLNIYPFAPDYTCKYAGLDGQPSCRLPRGHEGPHSWRATSSPDEGTEGK